MKKLGHNQLAILGHLMSAPQNLLESYSLPQVRGLTRTVTIMLRDGLIDRPWGDAPKGNHLRDFVCITEKGRQAFAIGKYK